MILQLEMIYGCISQGELRRTHSILHYATIAFVYEGSEGDTRDFLGEGWDTVALERSERHFFFKFKRIQKHLSAVIQRSMDQALDRSRFQANK